VSEVSGRRVLDRQQCCILFIINGITVYASSMSDCFGVLCGSSKYTQSCLTLNQLQDNLNLILCYMLE
jgi:hypothetical protein